MTFNNSIKHSFTHISRVQAVNIVF